MTGATIKAAVVDAIDAGLRARGFHVQPAGLDLIAMAALRALAACDGLHRHLLTAIEANNDGGYVRGMPDIDTGAPSDRRIIIDGDFDLPAVTGAMLAELVKECERDGR